MTTRHLQDELKSHKPFESLEQEAVLNLMRTHDRLQHQVNRFFRAHGLTPVQYNILRILRGAGAPLPCLDIADRLIAVVPGITGLVDRLCRQGLITRKRSTRDRRVVLVTLTADGKALLDSLDGPVVDLHRQLLGHLDESALRQLIDLLEQARAPWPSSP